MKRRAFLQTSVTATLAMTMTSVDSLSAIGGDEANAVRVLFIYGGHGYDVAAMNQMLDNLPGIKVTQMELSAALPLLKPGLKNDFDVLLLYDYTSSDYVTEEQQQNFVQLLEQDEIGVVFWHHAIMSHFRDDYNIIGGRYHFQKENFLGKERQVSTWKYGVDIPIQIANREHPITKGLEPFTFHDEVYNGISVNPAVDVLLTADHPECMKQALWTHSFGKCRIVYLMPGHGNECWSHPVFPKLLTRCMLWSFRGKIVD